MAAIARRVPRTAALAPVPLVPVTLALAALALAGCASLRGEPISPAISKVARQTLADRYAAEHVLDVYYNQKAAGAERRAYRDQIAYIWLSAYDAEYDHWVHGLSREMKGSSLGAAWAVLVMNGAAVVSGAEAARALAVGSSAVVGGSAAFKRDVLLDQTIDAVIMRAQAERSRAATAIRKKLIEQDAEAYPLGDALWEIGRLNAAANLNRASGEVTANAAADLRKAQDEARRLVVMPLMTETATDLAGRFAVAVDRLPDARLADLAGALGVTPDADDAEETRFLIKNAFALKAHQGPAAVNALTERLQAITGEEFKL